MTHKIKIGFLLLTFVISAIALQGQDKIAPTKTKIRTLIIDGQNNHEQWPKISYMLMQYLNNSGLFTAEISRTAFTWRGEEFLDEYAIEGMRETKALGASKPDPDFKPDFSKYDLVICNFGWEAAPWPSETQLAFEAFVEAGGGVVVFHAADNSFPEWKAYNKMIGLGGWGDRNEKDGPYVYYNEEGTLIRDTTDGSAGAHGAQTEYQVQLRNTTHPITKGMPLKWMHAKDELYHSLRGPAENMEVLATGYASVANKGTGRHEPVLMAINYGQGRIFHSIMGHIDYSVECVGFITTILRGSEWAATGKVTQSIPKDFPSEEASSSRKFDK